MDLSKHQSGAPLSGREHEQRVNAARARWAALATATGALIGERVAFQHHLARELLDHADRLDLARQRAKTAAEAEGVTRESQIRNAVAARLRARRESQAERFKRVMGTGQAARSPAFTIGSEAHPTEIYDLVIDRHQRQLRSDETLIRRLEAKDTAAFDAGGEALTTDERRALTRANASAQAHRDELKRLLRFKDKAHARIVAAAYRRQGQEIPPHITRQFKGGETLARMKARRDAEKLRLRHPTDPLKGKEGKLLALVGRRTERLARTHGTAAMEAERAAIHAELLTGRLRASGKGALLGAGLGFTAAGLGILAHHFATTLHQPRRTLTLAKAERTRSQDSIAAGLARTYRAWIDRLLGRSEQPMNTGDDIGHAMAPGLATAFAQGAANPPVDVAGSDPRWSVGVDFDQLNPAQRQHMMAYALDRIVDITNDQREAIRRILLNHAVLQGIGPPEVSRHIREAIGLTPYQQDVVRGFRTQLETLDIAALERKLRDRRFDRTLRTAIETDTPLSAEQIDAMVDAYQRRFIALRATTIARTESIRAATQGALARAQQVLDTHPELDVIKTWRATEDERTRPTHRDLDGQEAQGMLTPFTTSAGNIIRWPVDDQAPADEAINCRCYLSYRFIPRRSALVAA